MANISIHNRHKKWDVSGERHDNRAGGEFATLRFAIKGEKGRETITVFLRPDEYQAARQAMIDAMQAMTEIIVAHDNDTTALDEVEVES